MIKRTTIKAGWFVISDTHFCHNNIIRYQGRPANHDHLMVEGWNKVVKNDDVVLHLGDLALGKKPEIARLLKQLRGNKYLVLGSHDKFSDLWYRQYGFIPILPTYQLLGEQTLVFFSHEPDPYFDGRKRMGVNIHGHIHRVVHRKWEPEHPKRYINVSAEVMDYTPKRIGELLGV